MRVVRWGSEGGDEMIETVIESWFSFGVCCVVILQCSFSIKAILRCLTN